MSIRSSAEPRARRPIGLPRPRRPLGENRTARRTCRRSVVLGGQCGGSAASADTFCSSGNRPTVLSSEAKTRAARMRRSAAARKNGSRPGPPTVPTRLRTRLVMNAVLPDWLSPVTATRSVRSCKSAVNVGRLLRQIILKEGKSPSLVRIRSVRRSSIRAPIPISNVI